MKDLQRLRELVYSRSQGYCEKCGLGLPESWALHHRKLKSRGGKDTVENLIALHHECHNLGTNSVHLNIKIAEENGWIVKGHADPAEVPITLHYKSIVILDSEGRYEFIEGEANGW